MNLLLEAEKINTLLTFIEKKNSNYKCLCRFLTENLDYLRIANWQLAADRPISNRLDLDQLAANWPIGNWRPIGQLDWIGNWPDGQFFFGLDWQ